MFMLAFSSVSDLCNALFTGCPILLIVLTYTAIQNINTYLYAIYNINKINYSRGFHSFSIEEPCCLKNHLEEEGKIRLCLFLMVN